MNQPYLIIPDLHGEIDLLHQVLDKFPDHSYVFLGDLVDRGPNSPDVVQTVIELCEAGRAVLCWGNHEDMMVRGVKYGIGPLFNCWIMNGGDAALNQYNTVRDKEAFARHIDWIHDHAVHWVTLDTPHGKILCSHASRPSSTELEEIPADETTYAFESDKHLWEGQKKYTVKDLPEGYLCSVHGHVPQVKPIPYPKYVESPNGNFHLLDIGSCFNGHLAVLDTQDMQYHLFEKRS